METLELSAHRWESQVVRVGVIGFVALGCVLAWTHVPFMLDDAYIAFRYGCNVAAGRGMVFNPEGPPLEGFSSPLWMLASAATCRIGGPSWVEPTIRSLGLSTFVVAVICASRAAGRLVPGTRLGPSLAAAALVSLLPAVSYYAVTGLEATAFDVVVLLVAAATANVLDARLGWLAAFVAPWLRPEAPWLGLVIVLQAWVQSGRMIPGRRSMVTLATLVLGMATVLVWRQSAFSDWVPNTYYAKSPQWGVGLEYIIDTFREGWVAPILVLTVGSAVRGPASARSFAVAAAAWFVAPVVEGGDWMPLSRMALPGLVCSCVAAAAMTAGRKGPIVYASWALVAAAVSTGAAKTLEESAPSQGAHTMSVTETRWLVRWLQRSGAESVALVDIGRLGFWTDLELVDLAGLTDPVIARLPGGHLEKPIDPEYLFDVRHPDVIVVRVNASPILPGPTIRPDLWAYAYSEVERSLFKAPQMREDFGFAFAIVPAKPRQPFYGQAVFVRRDFRLPPDMPRPPLEVLL